MHVSHIARSVPAELLVALLWAPALVAGASLESLDARQAPGSQPRFQPGDTLTIAGEHAKLMLGNQVVAALPQGHRIVVAEVRDAWVGVYVSVDGQPQGGWLTTADFVPRDPAMPAGPQVYTTAKPVITEPLLAADTVPAIAIPFRARYIGVESDNASYEVGHMVDPDIHAWEPWRQRCR